MMQGGAFLTSGADTCVYAPEVACAKQPKPPLPTGSYVSRITEKKGEAKDKRNQALVKDAIQRIKEKYSMDVSGSFNLAAAVCTPKFKEADLVGGPCEADENNTTAPGKQKDKFNFVTPKQDEDFKDSTEARNPVIVEKLRRLFRDVIFLNNEGIVHGDIHDGNVSWMGDHLVLHDWGRTYHGVKGMRKAMKERYFDGTHLQELFDKCTIVLEGKPDDDTLRRYMMFFDIVNMTYELLKNSTPKVQHADLDTFIGYLNTVWDSKVSGDELRVKILRGVHTLFPQGQAAPPAPAAPPPPPPAPPPPPPAPPPPKDDLHEGGGQTERFCSCVKKVKKTLKARPGSKDRSAAEGRAIAICTKSVLQTKGRTLRKVRCRDKVLETQPMKAGQRTHADHRETQEGGKYAGNGVHTFVFVGKGKDDKMFLPLATGLYEKEFRVRYSAYDSIWKKNPVARVVVDGDGEMPVHRAIKAIGQHNPYIGMGTNTFIDTYFIDERLLSKTMQKEWTPRVNRPNTKSSRDAAAGEPEPANKLIAYATAPEPNEGQYADMKKKERDELLGHLTYDQFAENSEKEKDFVAWVGSEIHRFRKIPHMQRFRCIVTRSQDIDIGKRTDWPNEDKVVALLDVITTLLHIDGRFVHGDMHWNNLAHMWDGTAIIHDFGEGKFRDYADSLAGPSVTGVHSLFMFWSTIRDISESPQYYHRYTQFELQAELLKPRDILNIAEDEAARQERLRKGIAAAKFVEAKRMAAVAAAAEAAAAAGALLNDPAAVASVPTPPGVREGYYRELDEAKRLHDIAFAEYEKNYEAVGEDPNVTTLTGVEMETRRLISVFTRTTKKIQISSIVLDLARKGLVYDYEGKPLDETFIDSKLKELLDIKIDKPYEERMFKKGLTVKTIGDIVSASENPDISEDKRKAAVLNLREILKTLKMHDYRSLTPAVMADPTKAADVAKIPPAAKLFNIKVYLEPRVETMYYQLARIWDILAVMKAIENVMNRSGVPGKLKGRVDLMEVWRKKNASKTEVRRIVNEMRNAFGVKASDEAEETRFAWTYWLQSNPARYDPLKSFWNTRPPARLNAAAMVVDPPPAPPAPDGSAVVVEDNVFGTRSPLTEVAEDGKKVFKPAKPPDLSEIQVVDTGLIQLSKQNRALLEYSRSVLEGQVVANDDGGPPGGRLEAADEDDVNVRRAAEAAGRMPLADDDDDDAPLAEAVEQHTLIKDLAPMVVGSYYRDHKGNPYTVIDEYIITDEDLPIFRDVMKQLVGGDPAQVAFIQWRFCLLYADMLRLRYEHLSDVFTIIDDLDRESKWVRNPANIDRNKVLYQLNRIGPYKDAMPSGFMNGAQEPDMAPPTGFEWTWWQGGQWNIVRQEDPDIEFKIKVLESDARLLDTEIRRNIVSAASEVLKQTDPDLQPTIKEEIGIAAGRQTPQQLLSAANRRINRARRWIRTQYAKLPAPAPAPPDSVDAAIGALVTVTAGNAPESARKAVEAEAKADAEAKEAEEAVAAPPSGGRRTSYRRGLSKLI